MRIQTPRESRREIVGRISERLGIPARYEGAPGFAYTIGEITVRLAVASGLGSARQLMDALRSGQVHYDFVEVMACPGGCSGGGGQPIHDGQDFAAQRGQQLYQLDAESPIRFSHENPDVQALYREYLGQPLSEKAHHLLHTDQRTWTL